MTSERSDSVLIAVIAAFTILGSIAILKGLNGILFSVVIAAIAGIVGLKFPTPKFMK